MSRKFRQIYFSHDSNARNDEKLLNVRMKHGAAGYGIFFMILERLRESENFTSVKDYNAIAFDLRVSAGDIKSIVEDFGLFSFTDDGERFYSESFMNRMNQVIDEKTAKSNAGRIAANARWNKEDVLDESQANQGSNATAMRTQYDGNTKEKKPNQKKRNQTKPKEKKNSLLEERFEEFWLAYPKKVNKSGVKQKWNNLDMDDDLFSQIMTSLENQKLSKMWTKENGQFIPYPMTWLNQKRWEDKLEPTQSAKEVDYSAGIVNDPMKWVFED